ncbi:MAG: hypothetical protein JWN94_1195 [Betaproteobacteria bacterium]|nr:hypothetical protein [Betaproteobacteria bacterium]
MTPNRLEEFFSADFPMARRRFSQAVAARGGRLDRLNIPGRGPCGEELGIDIGWFGAAEPRRVLVHSSGLHGIEGYAGSAIQLQWLAEGLPGLAPDAAIVIAHLLNPYGYAWLRRVNENNVDLNRNFGAPDTRVNAAAQDYAALDSLLNPQSPPASDFFLARSAWLVMRHGMRRLRQTVIGGQTMNPRGLFYTGLQTEASVTAYADYLAANFLHARSIVAIDVHTGFGRYGEDTLMLDAAADRAELNARMTAAFGARVQLADGSNSAYSVEGSHQDLYSRLFPRADVHFATQEFGTLHALRVLTALRAENRWHHFGTGDFGHAARRRLLEVFCPADAAWRAKVLSRGSAVIEQACLLAFSGGEAPAAQV